MGDRQYDFRIPTVELFSCIVLTASEGSQDYSIEPAWTLLCHCTIANYVSVDLVRFQFDDGGSRSSRSPGSLCC